jgi:hypothetical protein
MHVYVYVNLLYYNEFEIFIYDLFKIMGKTTRNAISNDKDLNILLTLKEKLDFIKSVKSVQTDLTNFVNIKD